MERDDGRRPARGVLVSLLDVGGGQSRVILDDVRSAAPRRDTSWAFDAFHTHKLLDNARTDQMQLSDAAYRDFGIAVMARLLALNDRVK